MEEHEEDPEEYVGGELPTFDDPFESLEERLRQARTDYELGFDYFWGFDNHTHRDHAPVSGIEWSEFRDIHLCARKVADAAVTLAAPLRSDAVSEAAKLRKGAAAYRRWLHAQIDYELGQIPYDQLQRLRADPENARYLMYRNTIQLRAARFFICALGDIGDRLDELTQYLVQHRGSSVAAYLSRVARCYVLNLPPEFAVMTRAALDAALQELVDDETVRKRVGGGSKRGRDVGLERRIEYFAAEGVFDAKTRRAALNLKEAGDDAIHVVPGLEPPMGEILEQLVTVLASLPSPG